MSGEIRGCSFVSRITRELVREFREFQEREKGTDFFG
jgi:hypothetical protein